MSYFTIPKHILAGKNALEEADEYLKACGNKAFIVTGKHVGKSPMMEQLREKLEALRINFHVFNEITGEPTAEMIKEGTRIYRENKCDFLIGIGGGSPLDSAKAIALMSVSSCEISEYMGQPIEKKIPPIVAIPTTAGTGSEATRFTIITDTKTNIKMLLQGKSLLPTLAIVDPDFSMDIPKSITASTGLDALTHAVEAYTSKKAFKLTDTFALSAIKRIMENLPKVYKNGYDAKAREEMSIAALEAGICINNSSVTLVHGMSRPIGALFHVPHGMSNAMLLGTCIQFALDGNLEKFANLGRLIEPVLEKESDEKAAKMFLDRIEELCSICQVPSLKEYGIDQTEFTDSMEKMAQDAIDSGSPANTMKEVTKDDCISIYTKAYDKNSRCA